MVELWGFDLTQEEVVHQDYLLGWEMGNWGGDLIADQSGVWEVLGVAACGRGMRQCLEPAEFLCNSQDLFTAAEKHLGFRNVWPEKESDAEDLILNLVDLLKNWFELEVTVERTSQSTDESGVIFSVELFLVEDTGLIQTLRQVRRNFGRQRQELRR